MPEDRTRIRWLMIALVFFATVINYLDRQTLSVVAPVLVRLVLKEPIDLLRGNCNAVILN